MTHWKQRRAVEEFHRDIKQATGVEGCPATSAEPQHTHIFSAIVAFIKLETEGLLYSISWYEQEAAIYRPATSGYLLANAWVLV